MIFWMLYANKVKGDIARLFSDDRARQVARTVLDDAENKVSQYFGTLVVVIPFPKRVESMSLR